MIKRNKLEHSLNVRVSAELLHRLESLCVKHRSPRTGRQFPVSYLARRAMECGVGFIEGDFEHAIEWVGDVFCRMVNEEIRKSTKECGTYEPGEFNPFEEIAKHISGNKVGLLDSEFGEDFPPEPDFG